MPYKSLKQIFILIPLLTLNPAHAQTWKELYQKADSLSDLESAVNLQQSLDLAKSSLEKAEAEFGQTDTNVADVLQLVAALLESGTTTPLTLRLCKRVMIVDLLENGSGRPREALPYAERALNIREDLLGPEHVEVAKSLQLIASIYFVMGRERGARPMVERGLSIYEKVHATGIKDYALALHNMGFMYYCEGNYQKATVYFSRALEIMRKILPGDDPDIAYTLTFLAVCYWSLGFYNEAEEPLKEALRSWQRIYGPESARSARRLGNLAQLYELQGRFSEAEALSRQSFALTARELSPDDPLLGRTYLSLGSLLKMRGKYAEAVDTLRKAIEILKGRDPRTAWAMRVIGECHFAQHDYAGAEGDFLKALAVGEGLHGSPSEGSTSVSLGLSRVYMRMGKFALADSMLGPILVTRQLLLGSSNPDVAQALEAYSEYYRLTGSLAEALDACQRAVAIRRRNFMQNSRMMSEQNALSFSIFLRQSVDSYLSIFLDFHPTHPNTIRTAAEIILSSKGQTTEQAMLRQKTLVAETDSATLALAEEYRYARFQLSTLYVEGPRRTKPADFRRQIDSLEKVGNELEASLARKSPSFAASLPENRFSIEDVISNLPPSSILIEYLKMNYRRMRSDTVIPRYIALVANADGNLNIVDLGEADKIDRMIERYLTHFNAMARLKRLPGAKEEKEYNAIASSLYGMLWRPLGAKIRGKVIVFVAPDAGLNLISFSGLIDADGKYLVERYPIQYVSAGRDLIQPNVKDRAATGLIALGDPNFNASVAERLSEESKFAAASPGSNESYQVRNVRSGCGVLNEMIVPRLPNTRIEVNSIARFWKERYKTEMTEVLVGSKATEERFKLESPGKRAIHVATHGYFLKSACAHEGNEVNSLDMTATGEHPLLQSGLLLAGANLHGKGAKEAGAEDGILTALEVSAMNLQGTRLVVLSACESGLGKVEQGEGVYGLRRAFQIAGARTIVSTLWQVPDAEAMTFMRRLYSLKASTYPELLRDVAIERIHQLQSRGRPAHPYAWGAFVSTGDWRIN